MRVKRWNGWNPWACGRRGPTRHAILLHGWLETSIRWAPRLDLRMEEVRVDVGAAGRRRRGCQCPTGARIAGSAFSVKTGKGLEASNIRLRKWGSAGAGVSGAVRRVRHGGSDRLLLRLLTERFTASGSATRAGPSSPLPPGSQPRYAPTSSRLGRPPFSRQSPALNWAVRPSSAAFKRPSPPHTASSTETARIRPTYRIRGSVKTTSVFSAFGA